jgi:hypothetical protein
MKNIILALALALSFSNVSRAQEQSATNWSVDFLTQNLKATVDGGVHANNLINWKVGEFAEFNMSAAGFGDVGKMKKYVASEDGNAIWLKQEMSGMVGNHLIEALIDRATGQMLKLRQDGQDQAIPTDKLEIISQDQARITVPAGTFDTVHIVAKSEKIKKMEIWANPRDTALDGSVQTIADGGMVTITLKLAKFGGK